MQEMCMWVIKGKEVWEKNKNVECKMSQSKTIILVSDWRACACVCVCERKHSMHPWVPRNVISLVSFSGGNRIFITGISSIAFTQGTEANREDMLGRPSCFGHYLCTQQLTLCTNTIHQERREGEDYFQNNKLELSDSVSSSIFTQMLLSPASCGSSFPTTRWRRVFCFGNSACRTHCLLSVVL